MQTVEDTPTTIHAVAYTDPTVTHYVKIEAGLHCITGQPGWLSADSEAELLQLCEANNVALPELPAEGKEVQEGIYNETTPQGASIAATKAVACRVAHVRESTDVDQDDRFITSSTGVPEWKVRENVGEGAVRAYEGSNYRCIQSHSVQAAFTPPTTPALWALEPPAGVEWPAWVQPTGAQDAYRFGQKVSHNGSNWISQRRANVWEPGTSDAGWQEQVDVAPEWPLWQQPIPGLIGREPYQQGAQVSHLGEKYISLQDENVWEPGVFGWKLQQEGSTKWAVGVSYSVGDVVTYEGQEYECIQAHTSIAPWIPPAVPALWQQV